MRNTVQAIFPAEARHRAGVARRPVLTPAERRSGPKQGTGRPKLLKIDPLATAHLRQLGERVQDQVRQVVPPGLDQDLAIVGWAGPGQQQRALPGERRGQGDQAVRLADGDGDRAVRRINASPGQHAPRRLKRTRGSASPPEVEPRAAQALQSREVEKFYRRVRAAKAGSPS
jgi:hypothetical protein